MPLFLQFFLKVRLSQQKLRTSSCSSTLLVGYKDHIDAVKLDRELEQWMQDAAHADKPCDENLTSVCNAILHLHILRVMGESWYSVKKIKHHQIYPFQSRLVPGTMPTAKQRRTTLHPCRFWALKKMFPSFPMKYLSHHLLNINMFKGKLIFSRALQFLAIKDGMDQSKWGVPRNRGTRAAKSMAPLSKPKCKVQGVWAHGTMLKLYVLDPRMPSDSSTVLEMLTWYSCISFEGHPEFQMISCTSLRTSACPCQTLPDLRTVSRAVQEASEIFSQKGQDLPKGLLLYDSLIFND